MVIENIIRILNKPLWREVETHGLYWFAQPELCPILLYSLVKGSTNQNLLQNKYSNLPFLALHVFLTPLLVASYTPPESKNPIIV